MVTVPPSAQFIERQLKRLLAEVPKWFAAPELREVSRQLSVVSSEGAEVAAVLLARDTRTVCAVDRFDRSGLELLVSAPEGAVAGAMVRGCPRRGAFLFVLMKSGAATRLEIPGVIDFFSDLTVVGLSWQGEGSVTEHTASGIDMPRGSRSPGGAAMTVKGEHGRGAGQVIVSSRSIADLRGDALLSPNLLLSEAVAIEGARNKERRSTVAPSGQRRIGRGILSKVGLQQEELRVVIDAALLAAERSQAEKSKGVALVAKVGGENRLFAGAAYQSKSDPRFFVSPIAHALSELGVAAQLGRGSELLVSGPPDVQLVVAIFATLESFSLPLVRELELLSDQISSAPVLSVSQGHEIGFLARDSWPKARWRLI